MRTIIAVLLISLIAGSVAVAEDTNAANAVSVRQRLQRAIDVTRNRLRNWLRGSAWQMESLSGLSPARSSGHSASGRPVEFFSNNY
jgi:hypothetical protein